MRIAGFGALTMGMILLNREDAVGEESATCHVTKALRTAGGPWIAGSDRKSLSARLLRDDWHTADGEHFMKSGSWGSITVALQPGRKDASRTLQIEMSTNEQPWTTIQATTAAQAWIANAFPEIEIVRTIGAIVAAQAARTTLWSGDGVEVALTVFQSKQSAPNSDFILKIDVS